MLTNPVYPVDVGVCPVCNGTKRQHYAGKYQDSVAGFSKVDHTIPCQNCGGQYMFGTSTGLVRHTKDTNLPCTHDYTCTSSKNCLHTFVCKHCGDTFQIDSGD